MRFASTSPARQPEEGLSALRSASMLAWRDMEPWPRAMTPEEEAGFLLERLPNVISDAWEEVRQFLPEVASLGHWKVRVHVDAFGGFPDGADGPVYVYRPSGSSDGTVTIAISAFTFPGFPPHAIPSRGEARKAVMDRFASGIQELAEADGFSARKSSNSVTIGWFDDEEANVTAEACSRPGGYDAMSQGVKPEDVMASTPYDSYWTKTMRPAHTGSSVCVSEML